MTFENFREQASAPSASDTRVTTLSFTPRKFARNSCF